MFSKEQKQRKEGKEDPLFHDTSLTQLLVLFFNHIVLTCTSCTICTIKSTFTGGLMKQRQEYFYI